MGYPEDKVQKALHAPENNHIKVAYQLVLDHKRMLKECKLKDKTLDVQYAHALSGLQQTAISRVSLHHLHPHGTQVSV